jgi:carbamoyl-phosphate synthase large subunit
MIDMMKYSILKLKKYSLSNLELISIRKEDIQKIRIWRNEQRDVLRQDKILTKKEQEDYFNTMIRPMFQKKNPEIVLFSFLLKGKCIGYGGLVHINWKAKRGEISFLTDTKRAKSNYKLEKDFRNFLKIILDIGFKDLKLNKITTETFEFRKNIINILEERGFKNEGILKNHTKINGKYYDSLLHCMFKEKFVKKIDNKQKNILITSISNKTTLIKQLKNSVSFDIKIFGGDSNVNCVGKFFVEKFWKMPLIENLEIEELIKYCKKNKINYIIPTRDGDLIYFSKNKSILLKNKIFVMVSTLKTINFCLDKINFYKNAKKVGLPVIQTFKNIQEVKSKKYVVKERFGAGSSQLRLNLKKQDAIIYAKLLRNPIFQPYILGEEFSIDAYVTKNGKVQGIIVRKRNLIVNGESKISQVVTNKKLEQVCHKMTKNFSFYGHIIIQVLVDSKNKIHLIECNSRFGGASSLSIECGLDSFNWFIKESLGQKLSKQLKKIPKKTLIRYSKDMFIS